MRTSWRKAKEKEPRMTEVSRGCKQGGSEIWSLLTKTQEEPQVGQGDNEWRLGSLGLKYWSHVHVQVVRRLGEDR